MAVAPPRRAPHAVLAAVQHIDGSDGIFLSQ